MATKYSLNVELPRPLAKGLTHLIPYAETDTLAKAIAWVSSPPQKIKKNAKSGYLYTARTDDPLWREMPHGDKVVAFSRIRDTEDEAPKLVVCSDIGIRCDGKRASMDAIGTGDYAAMFLDGDLDKFQGDDYPDETLRHFSDEWEYGEKCYDIMSIVSYWIYILVSCQ